MNFDKASVMTGVLTTAGAAAIIWGGSVAWTTFGTFGGN